jgi:hypothetical protein
MPRKSKAALPGKRHPLNMRTTKELREKIERAALASGRSLVQEVEFRLEQSLDGSRDALLSCLLGGGDRTEVLRLLASVLMNAPIPLHGAFAQDADETTRSAINIALARRLGLPDEPRNTPEAKRLAEVALATFRRNIFAPESS